MADLTLGGRFKVLNDQKLGTGGFGVVYKGVDLQTGEYVAIKTSKHRDGEVVLQEEVKVLKDLNGIKGVPKIYYDGFIKDDYFVVMDLLGEDLEHKYKERCTVRDVCIIAQQVIKTLEKIHERGYLHLDLKTRNLMVGHKNPNEIYLIDFGGACKVNGENVERQYKSFTAYYASVNMLNGFTPSRKDDLIMFGYVLFDLLSLIPWKGNEGNYHLIQMKKDLSWILRGRGSTKIPQQFYQYQDYCQELRFSQVPDYAYLSSLFQDAFVQHGFKNGEVLTGTVKDEGTTIANKISNIFAKVNPRQSLSNLLGKLGN